jgi:hypothetical protein
LGFLSIALVTIISMATYAAFIAIRGPKVKERSTPCVTILALRETLMEFRMIFILNSIMSFGLFSGAAMFFMEPGKPTYSDCHNCSIYFTSTTHYIGNILGQDGALTVLRTPSGAVVLKTPDITAVQPFDGKPQIPKLRKTVAIPPAKAVGGK